MIQSKDVDNKIYVYVAKFPFETANGSIPELRQREMDSCASEYVKQSKYYVFKLLEKALYDVFGLKLCDVELFRDESGKWKCPLCEFSLSHSGNTAAVALTSKPVGVDIERIDENRFAEDIQNRILTDREKEFSQKLSKHARAKYANYIWTVKESVFKMRGGDAFTPRKTETENVACVSKIVESDCGKYFLTVTASDNLCVEFICCGVRLSAMYLNTP